MKCEKVRRNLSAYADGEVGEKLRGQIAEHLSVCERCAAEFSQLEEVAGMAKSSLREMLSAKRLPSDLRPMVMRSVQPIRPPRVVVLSVRNVVAGAALISLIVATLVGVVLGSSFRSQRDALRVQIAEHRRALNAATSEATAVEERLMVTQARTDALEEELRLAVEKVSDRDELASETSRAYAWRPVFSSLQMPGARRLLENGLF
jgi:anti-sigma factor RsiW